MKKSCSKLLFIFQSKLNNHFRFGFTLIEILIAISIMTILFSLGLAQYMKFNRQQILNQAILTLKSNLVQARDSALAGKKACSGTFDGVLVEFRDELGNLSDKKYKISASCNDGTDLELIGEIHQYPSEIKKTGGPEEILFKTLTGGTNLNEEKTISLFAYEKTAKVKVTPDGNIELIF